LWNLGAILYVLATGEYPFEGEDDAEIMKSIREIDDSWKPKWKRGTNELFK
jgi:serine/threonine protein kinase